MQNRRKGATAYAYAVKNLRTPKPSHTKKPFCGHCLYGLYEAAMPVIIGESVAAVVYVGNAITDIDQTNCRIDKACHYIVSRQFACIRDDIT